MKMKPTSKPMVLDWLNPLANGRLTIKQYKTRQDKVGFGFGSRNQNPPYSLSVNLTSKVISLASSLYAQREAARSELCRTRLSTGFQHSFPQLAGEVA